MQPDGSTRIPLWGRGGVVADAVIDAEDETKAGVFRWNVLKKHGKVYARANVWSDGKRIGTVYLHRIVSGEPPDSFRRFIDHIDGDGLNNRKSNLRWVTPGQNQQNRLGATFRSLSGVRGVRYKRKGQWSGWEAQGRLAGKTIHIGYYPSLEEAAAAVAEWRRIHMPFSAPDVAAL